MLTFNILRHKSEKFRYQKILTRFGALYFSTTYYTSLQTNPKSGENFDSAFTKMTTVNTPLDSEALQILNDLRGDEFSGFDFVNSTFVQIQNPNANGGKS